MDVSHIIAEHAAKQQATTVEKDVPLEIDAGLLTVTDLNPIDSESYEAEREDYLMSTARDGVQALLSALFALPTIRSPDGPLAQLPPPTTELPRTKPLPKPKPPTKWEKFANAKGIQHRKRDKKEWNEEKQEWVDRWGWKGANKDKETPWITEVPANADIDFDPRKAAKKERQDRVAKNEKQRQQNAARAQKESQELGGSSSGLQPQSQRKRDIERTLATTRTSTASMGKFDKKLEGEKKLRGVKRKFEAAEVSASAEKSNNLAILAKLDREPNSKKSKKGAEVPGSASDGVLNVRKAVRFASKGRGSAALARDSGGRGKSKTGKR